MARKDILQSPYYWTAQLQIELYKCAEEFMQKNGMNRTQFAQYLGVSKAYVTQLLSGDYNYSIEKLFELCLKLEYVPQVSFSPLSQVLEEEVEKSQKAQRKVFKDVLLQEAP